MSGQLEQYANRFSHAAPRLLLLLARKLQVPLDDARDALHAVFVSLIDRIEHGEHPPNLADEEAFLRYFFKAARNRLIDRARDAKRHEQAELLILRSIGPSPEEILLQKEQNLATEENLTRLRTAIEALKPPYHQIFRKLIYERKQLVEIAEELGISKGSIYTQYSRGLDRLAKSLGISRRKL